MTSRRELGDRGIGWQAGRRSTGARRCTDYPVDWQILESEEPTAEDRRQASLEAIAAEP